MQINNNNSGLMPIFPEEDFAFFPANQEIPEFVDELIGLFLKHSKFLLRKRNNFENFANEGFFTRFYSFKWLWILHSTF